MDWLLHNMERTDLIFLSIYYTMSRLTIISAPWCKPCTHLKEELPKVAVELECEIPVVVEKYDEEIHHVDKLPTTCFTIDGLEKCRMIGTDKDRLKSFIRTCMAYDSIETFGFED